LSVKAGPTMDLHVCQIKQGASGGSYVVRYDAEMELLDDRKTVEVEIVGYSDNYIVYIVEEALAEGLRLLRLHADLVLILA
jgi:hypothetical protein